MSKHDIFKDYLSPVFVETGTYMGDGAQAALDHGFSEIHSIELSKPLYRDATERFAHDDRVHLYLGDSGVILGNVIAKIDGRITFWLDGHFHPMGKNRADNPSRRKWGLSKTKKWSPILTELEYIKSHPISDHTILIDDIGEMGTPEYGGLTVEDLKGFILEINSSYSFQLRPSYRADDILAAVVRG